MYDDNNNTTIPASPLSFQSQSRTNNPIGFFLPICPFPSLAANRCGHSIEQEILPIQQKRTQVGPLHSLFLSIPFSLSTDMNGEWRRILTCFSFPSFSLHPHPFLPFDLALKLVHRVYSFAAFQRHLKRLIESLHHGVAKGASKISLGRSQSHGLLNFLFLLAPSLPLFHHILLHPSNLLPLIRFVLPRVLPTSHPSEKWNRVLRKRRRPTASLLLTSTSSLSNSWQTSRIVPAQPHELSRYICFLPFFSLWFHVDFVEDLILRNWFLKMMKKNLSRKGSQGSGAEREKNKTEQGDHHQGTGEWLGHQLVRVGPSERGVHRRVSARPLDG